MLSTLRKSIFPTSSLANLADNSRWDFRLINDLDDDIRDDTLNVVLVFKPSTISTSTIHSITLVLLSYSWRLPVVSTVAPVFYSFSDYRFSDICCNVFDFLYRLILGYDTAKHCIFSSHRHADIYSQAST